MSVSVVITCHNEERTVEQAVRSVAAQSAFERVSEIIVVNDGSRDGSRQVLERLADEIAELRVIETPGLGLSAARNCALREATGEFIAILDGDDYWAPEKLERQLPAFDETEGIGLVYGDFVDFTRGDAADGRTVTVRRFDPRSRDHLRDYFVHDGPIVPSSVIISFEALRDVGPFDESLDICEDTEFHLRVAENWRFCHVPGALTFKRRHPQQMSHRIDAFLPNAALVTERFCSRHPELQSVAARRMARCHVKASADCAGKGERARAFRYGLAGLRLAPFYWRGWANLVLILAPTTLSQPVYGALKRRWHIARQSHRR